MSEPLCGACGEPEGAWHMPCPGCGIIAHEWEWLVGTLAHADTFCDGAWLAIYEWLCWRCVDAWAIPRCRHCHDWWDDGALMRPDDVLAFA